MSAELTASLEYWQKLRGLFNDFDSYHLLENLENNRTYGLIVRGFDASNGVERILAIPLNPQGEVEEDQMLFELWQEGIFAGKLSVSRISVGEELSRMGIRSGFEIPFEFFDERGPAISRWLATLTDGTWRNMVKEVLTPSSAGALYRQQFPRS
jgi:hypothetical protein